MSVRRGCQKGKEKTNQSRISYLRGGGVKEEWYTSGGQGSSPDSRMVMSGHSGGMSSLVKGKKGDLEGEGPTKKDVRKIFVERDDCADCVTRKKRTQTRGKKKEK